LPYLAIETASAQGTEASAGIPLVKRRNHGSALSLRSCMCRDRVCFRTLFSGALLAQTEKQRGRRPGDRKVRQRRIEQVLKVRLLQERKLLSRV
jgi:hypothetical protein